MERLGQDAANAVDWSAPRLLCIAGDFTRYDEHAVKQIARNIELIRYRRFGETLLMMELVHAPKTSKISNGKTASGANTAVASDQTGDAGQENDPYLNQRMSYRLAQSSADLRDIHDAVLQFLTALGEDVQIKELKYYTAFKRIKNFVCMEIYPQAKVVTLFLKLDPDTVTLEDGFTRDVRNVGHFGTGDLQVTLKTMADLEKAQPLVMRAYEGG